MTTFGVGDRVRVKAKGSRYYGHVGVVVGQADSGEWAVRLDGMTGKWRIYYRSDELEATNDD